VEDERERNEEKRTWNGGRMMMYPSSEVMSSYELLMAPIVPAKVYSEGSVGGVSVPGTLV
jgi:hypothetical protein